MKPRHEYKIMLNNLDYVLLRNRLRLALAHDAHVDENGEYSIRSLYFDTPQDTALREKIDGLNHRDKYRIRIYNCDTSIIHLEKKSKHNDLCYKTSTNLTLSQTLSIIRGDIQWMQYSGDALITELYLKMTESALQPKTLVDYIREPFCYAAGNVRITLDRHIRTGLFSTDLFNRDLPLIPTDPNAMLVEVKYDEFIPPHILNLLQLQNRRAGACSKYALCRIYG